MRLSKYASAAYCRHTMALPWKCRSYLPTSRAISQTSHEKGSFLIRSSVLFWNCQISQRATVPGQYFLVFLTFPAWINSFWGALLPTVSQSFLQIGSSPKAEAQPLQPSGPTVGLAMMMVTYPHPPVILPPQPASQPPSTSCPPPSQVRAFWLGRGGALEREPPSLCSQLCLLLLHSEHPPSFPLLLSLFGG